jgi:hypothetical protein
MAMRNFPIPFYPYIYIEKAAMPEAGQKKEL